MKPPTFFEKLNDTIKILFNNFVRSFCKIIIVFIKNNNWLNKRAYPHAAVFYITRSDKILAVSRKNNPNDFGLPGGRVEPLELDVDAAIRELKEETGINLHFIWTKQIFEALDDHGYWTVCFMPIPNLIGNQDYQINTTNSTETGVVDWITKEELLSGSFGNYNKKILQKIENNS